MSKESLKVELMQLLKDIADYGEEYFNEHQEEILKLFDLARKEEREKVIEDVMKLLSDNVYVLQIGKLREAIRSLNNRP